MAGTFRVRRSLGALSGALLVLLGIWGALIPFVGPYFHYAFTPDHSWTATAGRIWLEVLPGAGTLLGGLIVLASRLRPAAYLGAWLAAVSGAWFAIGSLLAPLWSKDISAGSPVGGKIIVVAERAGMFVGLGIVIVFVAAAAMGRLSVVAVRDAARARKPVVKPAAERPAQVLSSPASVTAALRRVVSGKPAGAQAEEKPADKVSAS